MVVLSFSHAPGLQRRSDAVKSNELAYGSSSTHFVWRRTRPSTSALLRRHTSSVTVGPGGDYYVALRNVNAVLRLARDRSGLVWSLSPTVPSNFTFAHEQDAFYDPHVPIAILDGDGRETRLLLIDNGQNRPNCTGAPDACYSRAVEYRLDFEAHVARVSWEFEFPFLLAKATDDEVDPLVLKVVEGFSQVLGMPNPGCSCEKEREQALDARLKAYGENGVLVMHRGSWVRRVDGRSDGRGRPTGLRSVRGP